MKSRNAIETYRDALTVFRRYITDTMNLSLRTFGFEDCTYDFLLSYIEFLHKNGNSETTCNNRLAAIRAYLWYAADCDISLQSVALTASRVPFLKNEILYVLCAEFLRKAKIRKNGIFRPFIPKTHNIIIYLTFLMKSGMS